MSLPAELERAEKSRKVPKFSFGDVVVHLSHELVELASGGITFHLPIPIIILERMQQRFQLATLFQRKLFNRSQNFSIVLMLENQAQREGASMRQNHFDQHTMKNYQADI